MYEFGTRFLKGLTPGRAGPACGLVCAAQQRQEAAAWATARSASLPMPNAVSDTVSGWAMRLAP